MTRALLWILALLAVAFGIRAWLRPTLGPQRVVVTPSITGVRDDVSYAWIIRTAHGALLVDTTADPRGKALLAELDAEKIDIGDVHTIVLTHGHVDHWAAASLFPAAKIYVGRGDAALMTGATPSQAPARFFARFTRPAGVVVPDVLNELPGDTSFAVDGLHLQAITQPGHTAGSTVYRVDDILFVGDTLRATRSGLTSAHWFYSDDATQALHSLDKLRLIDFRRAATGHSALIDNAKSHLLSLLAQ